MTDAGIASDADPIITNQWVDDGKLRWWQGVSLTFQCKDGLAIYREIRSRGIAASELFVGNSLWTFSLSDPDGYRIEFASPTDMPEETTLSALRAR